MPSQTGKNIVVAYKLQSVLGTAPGASGAKQLRLTPSPGLSLKKAAIQSNEIRSDGQTTMGRHGSREAPGSYNIELSVGSFDEILEALMRSTWVAAVPITFDSGAALTSLTVNSSSQITFAGTTTPIAAGLRVGDVFRLTNMSTGANNNVNCRVKSIAASVVNLHGTPLTTQAADSACTLTIAKKLKNGATPTKRAFYIDEYNQDIDASEVFDWCRFVGLRIRGTPDGMAEAELTVLGATAGPPLSGGAAPYFTSPTQFTAGPLVFADATLSYNGVDIAIATAFELNLGIGAKTEPVIGSPVSPDVFDNDMRLSGSLTFIRQDLANVQKFIDETEVELHLLLVELEAEPKDFISICVPRLKLTAADAPLGNDGAMIETLPFMNGKKEGAGAAGYDDSTLTISTSAA
jgi:hypothetical protein